MARRQAGARSPVQRIESLPAVQGRSQATRDRLLDAAETVLARDGLEGATVPAIAARAGVAVGSVYRRFPDKDALMRGVYERFFADSLAHNRLDLAPERWRDVDAAEMVRRLVSGMVAGYRLKRPILRALIQYGETHADAAFRRRAEQLRAETFRLIADLLSARRGEVKHPNPREAVPFVLTIVRLTLQGLLRQEDGGSRIDDDGLTEELTRLVSSYLGVSVPARRGGKS